MERTTEQIRIDVKNQLRWDTRVHHDSITVDVTDHSVILSGSVESNMERKAAEADVWSIPGVVSVANQLAVENPATTRRIPDEEIQWNIKSVLALNATIDASRIDLTVTGGAALINGSVDAFWKKLKVEELTSDVPGVTRVINTLAVVESGNPRDGEIARDIINALSRLGGIDLDEVTVDVLGGVVELRGRVPNWQAYSSAYTAAKFTRGVVDLTNSMVIA